VKHFENTWKSEKLGEIDIFLDEGTQLNADANLGRFYDAWFDIAADADNTLSDGTGMLGSLLKIRNRSNSSVLSSKEAAQERSRAVSDPPRAPNSSAHDTPAGDVTKSTFVTSPVSRDRAPSMSSEDSSTTAGSGASRSRLHVWVLLHRPPPDPVPTAVVVEVIEGKALMAADTTGFSDPYVKIRPKVRVKESSVDQHGKTVELLTLMKTQTLDPVWNEAFLFYDVDRREPSSSDVIKAVGDPRIVESIKEKQGVVMANTRYLEFALMDEDAVGRDDPLGEVIVPFSDLFGDEDAVFSENSIRIQKWYRVHPLKSMDHSLEGTLGHLRLHITMIFDSQLLPPNWQEAIDNDTNESYFYNTVTKVAQWEEPMELAAWRAESAPLSDSSTTGTNTARSTEERYRRGSVDALMFLALQQEPGAVSKDTNLLSAIDEALDGELSDEGGHDPVSTCTTSTAASPVPQAVERNVLASNPRPADTTTDVAADDDPDMDFDAAAVAEAVASLDPYRTAKVATPAEFSNPMAAAAAAKSISREASQTDRMKAMTEAMNLERQKKRQAEEEAEAVSLICVGATAPRCILRYLHRDMQARLAGMTPEERSEYDAAKQRDNRREQRKNRMLQTQFSGYSSTKNPLARGKKNSSKKD
jgi:hypothetical protein